MIHSKSKKKKKRKKIKVKEKKERNLKERKGKKIEMLRFTFSVSEVPRSLKFFSPPSPPLSSYLVKRNVRLFGAFYKLMVGEDVCLKK